MSHYPAFGFPAVYVDPTIVSFVASPAVAEMGSTVAVVTLSWATAKTPDKLKVAGIDLAPNTQLAAQIGPFTTNQSWSMSTSDSQRSNAAKATLTFLNQNYLGFANAPPANSAAIRALGNGALTNGRAARITIGSPIGIVLCYAFPKRYGVLKKIVLTVENDAVQPTHKDVTFTDYTTDTVAYTNLSGFTEDYYVVTFNAPVPYRTAVVQFS